MKTQSGRRRVLVGIVDRANFGRLLPVMKAIQATPSLELKTLATGTTVLERFGLTRRSIEAEGFSVDAEIYVELEGGQPITMAKSLGFCIIEAATAIRQIAPDLLLLIGDRYEALGLAIAAAYQNVPIAHIQGGEISGSIDESARHAISKFAQFHFPSTLQAARLLIQMGERPETIFVSGCPSGDIIRHLDSTLPDDVFNTGVGDVLDPHKPFILTVFHPVTTTFGREEYEVSVLLDALRELKMPTVWLWPNIDAGGDHISKVLRRYREKLRSSEWPLRLVKGFDPITYQRILSSAALAVGNSSSFVRDASFTGVPVVLIGDRQQDRETAQNALRVAAERQAILDGCRSQLRVGRYSPSALYGVGRAAPYIAECLTKLDLYVQKRIQIIPNLPVIDEINVIEGMDETSAAR